MAALRNAIPVMAVLLLTAAAGDPACIGCSGDGITDCQVQKHAEASLVYPGATGVTAQVKGEDNGQTWFENLSPTPAHADVQFHTSDAPSAVYAWYDQWLKTHAWEDAQTTGDGRYWQRGGNEQASINRLTYLKDSPYDFLYSLLSSRFPPNPPAAIQIGDPVSAAAVLSRDAGIQDYFGLKPTDNAAEAKRQWHESDFAYYALRMASRAEPEQASPPRAAYRLLTFQVAEYGIEGHLLSSALGTLDQQGFRRLANYTTTIAGAPADEYLEARGDREVYEIAIGYGPVTHGLSTSYRVATVSVVYAILPKACSAANPDCVNLAPAPNSAVGP